MHRADPPVEGSERTMLVGWLDYDRDTLAVKCDGLTNEQLDARPIASSALSLAGLTRHLAEVERTYFQRVFAGREVPLVEFEDDPFREDSSADYSSSPESDAAVAATAWRAAVSSSRLIISDTKSLTDTGQSGLPLRFWLVKTLNEYARHNGHADVLRELIDGSTGE